MSNKKNISIGILTGLAALVNVGCPTAATVDVSNISYKDWFNGRTEELCEKELQENRNTFQYGPITVEGVDIPLGFRAEIVPDPHGKNSIISAEYTWEKLAANTWMAEITIKDVADETMNWSWTNGATNTLGISLYDSNLGPELGLFRQAEGLSRIDERSPYTDTIHYTIVKGLCNGSLTNEVQQQDDRNDEQDDIINDLNNDLDALRDNLNDHTSGNSEPPQHYVIGDGRCDSQLGEPADSVDCQNASPPYVEGDGECSPGEPLTSVDCVPPQGPSELERLAEWACVNLPRAVDNPNTSINEGRDIRLFYVSPNSGTFSYTENPNLTPDNPEWAFVDHIIAAGPTNGNYWIATAGTALGDAVTLTSGNQGYNIPECTYAIVINPELQDIQNGIFSIEANGDTNITEVVRAIEE